MTAQRKRRGRGTVQITWLSTGYWHATGDGPCEWAQWPDGEELTAAHFFPEASDSFRRRLRAALKGAKT